MVNIKLGWDPFLSQEGILTSHYHPAVLKGKIKLWLIGTDHIASQADLDIERTFGAMERSQFFIAELMASDCLSDVTLSS